MSAMPCWSSEAASERYSVRCDPGRRGGKRFMRFGIKKYSAATRRNKKKIEVVYYL